MVSGSCNSYFILIEIDENLLCSVGIKKAAPKRKKPSSKTETTQQNTANITVAEPDVTIQTTARMMSTKRGNDWSVNLNEFLRCMDPDILILFDEELVLKYPLPVDLIGTKLGLMEFRYACANFNMTISNRLIGPFFQISIT